MTPSTHEDLQRLIDRLRWDCQRAEPSSVVNSEALHAVLNAATAQSTEIEALKAENAPTYDGDIPLSRIGRLRALARAWEEGARYADTKCREMREERDALKAENARMGEALKPFAEAADREVLAWDKDKQEHYRVEQADHQTTLVSWGDLRRARAALSPDTTEKDNE